MQSVHAAILKYITVFCLCFAIALTATLAPSRARADDNTSVPSSGPRKRLATIIYAGLGGAVLGLSTLSFYGRPQDRLGNIGVGFALGIIAGTAYVTYEMVHAPNEAYALNAGLHRDPNILSDQAQIVEPSDINDVVMNSQISQRVRSPGTSFSIANFSWSF